MAKNGPNRTLARFKRSPAGRAQRAARHAEIDAHRAAHLSPFWVWFWAEVAKGRTFDSMDAAERAFTMEASS